MNARNGARHAALQPLLDAAYRRAVPVLDEQTLARVAHGHALAERAASERPVYGRSTGVGANRDIEVRDHEAQLHRLLRSHATSFGEARDEPRVRATVALRIGQLALGGSGISRSALEGLVMLLADGPLPLIREGGGLGTGDLAAMASIGAALLDDPRGPWLRAGDGLPLISSNAATLADTLLAAEELRRLAVVATDVAALTCAAINANTESYSPHIATFTPVPGAARVAAQLREAWAETPWKAARVQDPFAVRCMPQVHGAAVDAIDDTLDMVQAMATTASENPHVGAGGEIVHHGAFTSSSLTLRGQTMLTAVASSAAQSLARTALLARPEMTGLHAFLADVTPGASGTMLVEYAVASRLATLNHLAAPVAGWSVSLSRGAEEGASFAPTVASSALRAPGEWRVVLAGELFTSLRALRQQGVTAPQTFVALQDALGPDEDRDLSPDLEAAHDFVIELERHVPDLDGV